MNSYLHNFNDRESLIIMHSAMQNAIEYLRELHFNNINDKINDSKYDDFDANDNARFDAMHFSDDDTDYAPACASIIYHISNALYREYEYFSPAHNLNQLLMIDEFIDDLNCANANIDIDDRLIDICESIENARE